MQTVSLSMTDGTSQALLWTPPEPRHAVIWACDALGIRPAAVAQAEKLASWGVAVLMPNLFWRYYEPPLLVDGSTVGGEDDDFAKNGMRLYQAYDFDHVGQDAPQWAQTLREASGLDTVSFVGFCMGGRVGLRTAAALGDTCTQVTAFHPGGLVRDGDPGSEHLMLDAVSAPVYFAYADNDPIMTTEDQQNFQSAATSAGLNLTTELYPEALHGFMMEDRPVFHPEASQRGWDHLATLYRS